MAIVGLVLRVFLVTVLAWSSIAKLRPSGFLAVVSMLRQLGIGRCRVFLAATLLGVEAATAVLLAVPATARAAAVSAVLLFTVLTAGVGVVLHRKLDVRCACFGAQTTRLSRIHLVRNGLLLACAAGACLATWSAPADPVDAGAPMNVIAVLLGLLAVVTSLNLFLLLGVIRRLREMTSDLGPPESGLPDVGARIGEFTEYTVDGDLLTEEQFAAGRSLVIMLSPSCQPCREAVDHLAENRHQLPPGTYVFVQAEPGDPKLAPMLDAVRGVGTVVVLSATGTTQSAFGIAGFPAAIVVEDGRVAFASFALTEALPLVREKMLSR